MAIPNFSILKPQERRVLAGIAIVLGLLLVGGTMLSVDLYNQEHISPSGLTTAH